MQVDKEKITVRLSTTRRYLKFWNGIFGMSDKELDILSVLIDTPGEICSRANRETSRIELEMSMAMMNTYVKRLKDRRAIRHENGKYILNRLLERRASVEIDMPG